MLEQTPSRILRAVEKVVTRFAGERVARDFAVRIRRERSLRRKELAPSGIVFLIVAEEGPRGLSVRSERQRGRDEPAIVRHELHLCVAAAIETGKAVPQRAVIAADRASEVGTHLPPIERSVIENEFA